MATRRGETDREIPRDCERELTERLKPARLGLKNPFYSSTGPRRRAFGVDSKASAASPTPCDAVRTALARRGSVESHAGPEAPEAARPKGLKTVR